MAAQRPIAAVVMALGLACGSCAGIAVFTFAYADGASYLRDDPAACANCHIMRGHLDAWAKSSHHAVATCNDCHTPHDFAGKWAVKAANGVRHSWAFTVGGFHEPIAIHESNRRVTEQSCLHCHDDLVRAMHAGGGELSCLHCHATAGHLE